MKKRGLIVFTLFAAVFAIGVPLWAIDQEGAASASSEEVAASDQQAKELFAINCGTCHTLERAGADGIVGPNLDELLGTVAADARTGNIDRVLTVIKNGREGRMPAGILRGDAAREVAVFAAEYAGR